MKVQTICGFAASAAMLFTGALATPSTALARKPPDVTVLLVGSSLVRGVKPTLKKMYKAEGLKAKVKGHGPAKWTLAKHAASPRTAKIIARRRWDFILLAQSSIGLLDTDLAFAQTLRNQVVANGSKPALMMTWYGQNTPLTLYDWLKGSPGATHGYIPIALQLGVPVAPAGWGIRTAVTDGMSTGLWRTGQHLSKLGRYLVGVVVYTTLTKKSPVGKWGPGKLSPTERDYIQTLAAETVLANAAEWNITLP